MDVPNKTIKIFCLLFLVSSCMRMGPDYQRPKTLFSVPTSYQHGRDSGPIPGVDDPWWEGFRDSDLNGVVEEALLNNLDIRRATARVLEVRARFVQSRAARLPGVDLQAQGQMQRQTLRTIQGRPAQRDTTDTYALSLPASFEVDLWGRLARAEEAARGDLLQAEENRRTIAQSVVAETITLFFQMESLERRIQITRESIASYKLSLKVVDNRYSRGLTSVLDVRQARRLLAQTEAALPPLRQELGTTQQRLAVLLGSYPETRPPKGHPEDYFQQLPPVPAGLPSELLRRRPDIRSLEAALVSLNARVGVAQASRFPRISLTGSYGYSSRELSDLFDPASELRRIALGIVQPLFDGGRLKADLKAAEARYQQGLADYARGLLNAFSEVEGALLARKEQLERRKKLLEFLAESRATQQVAQNRYLKGLINYINVLDAQQTRFLAEQNIVAVDLALLVNRVNLFRALGGGWGDPGPVRPGRDIYKLTTGDYLL